MKELDAEWTLGKSSWLLKAETREAAFTINVILIQRQLILTLDDWGRNLPDFKSLPSPILPAFLCVTDTTQFVSHKSLDRYYGTLEEVLQFAICERKRNSSSLASSEWNMAVFNCWLLNSMTQEVPSSSECSNSLPVIDGFLNLILPFHFIRKFLLNCQVSQVWVLHAKGGAALQKELQVAAGAAPVESCGQ